MDITIGTEQTSACRVFCIGKNYAEHIREMGGKTPGKPVVFMKPATSLIPAGQRVVFPSHGRTLHHEAELVVMIGLEGRPTTDEEALTFVRGVSLGLDLTLRDVQGELKSKGLPWEISKAFDQSAPIGSFVPYDDTTDLDNIEFSCRVNGELRQEGNTRDLIYSIPTLLIELGKIWKLMPGDLIYTGTPSGVGPLGPGDTVTIESEVIGSFSWIIVASGSGLNI